MKSIKQLSSLAVFLIAAVLTGCAGNDSFTFVHMSDTQIGFIDESPHFVHSDSLMKAAVSAANALDPSCVIITGDLVNSAGNAEQDSIYRANKAMITAPVYEVLGNHDIRGYDRFSFMDHGCAFIGIDSNCIKDGDEKAEAEQLEWLKKELTSSSGARMKFIFLHCPLIRERIDEKEDYFNFPVAKREEYISLFKETGVTAVFAGHTHEDFATEYDGIGFYAAGPVGNALGHGTPGYNVVKVEKGSYSVNYVPTPGIDPTHCRF